MNGAASVGRSIPCPKNPGCELFIVAGHEQHSPEQTPFVRGAPTSRLPLAFRPDCIRLPEARRRHGTAGRPTKHTGSGAQVCRAEAYAARRNPIQRRHSHGRPGATSGGRQRWHAAPPEPAPAARPRRPVSRAVWRATAGSKFPTNCRCRAVPGRSDGLARDGRGASVRAEHHPAPASVTRAGDLTPQPAVGTERAGRAARETASLCSRRALSRSTPQQPSGAQGG